MDETTSKWARRPFPDYLPRKEVIRPAPCNFPSCGGKMRRIGLDETEKLEHVPGCFKMIGHARQAFSYCVSA